MCPLPTLHSFHVSTEPAGSGIWGSPASRSIWVALREMGVTGGELGGGSQRLADDYTLLYRGGVAAPALGKASPQSASWRRRTLLLCNGEARFGSLQHASGTEYTSKIPVLPSPFKIFSSFP